jgi:mRNA interferase HigB
MRIYSYKTLRKFWEKFPDSRISLEIWHKKMETSSYQNPNQIMADFKGADIVGNNRIVFNIAHNKYRLIVYIRYSFFTVYVKFIGTHAEYDRINDVSTI